VSSEADLPAAPASFYYDLASPEAYVAAERIVGVLEAVPEFVPVTLAGLAAGQVGPFRCQAEIEAYQEDLRRRTAGSTMLPWRWPAEFPPDSDWAMLVATYAKQGGRVVAYSMAAWRQVFAAGRDLGDRDTVLLAAAAAEMHPAAVLKGSELRGVRNRLQAATEGAAEAGVLDVPAVRIGDRVFHGDAELEAAAEALADLLA
jgi:2-hydroxychromene-2-carboxylate isomerase